MFYIGFFNLKKWMRDSLIPSFLVSDVSKSLRWLTKNERCERLLRSLTKNERWERIAQVAHQKWATISESLKSITKHEQIALFFSVSLIY